MSLHHISNQWARWADSKKWLWLSYIEAMLLFLPDCLYISYQHPSRHLSSYYYRNSEQQEYAKIKNWNAKIRFFKVLGLGFNLETTLKSFVANVLVSDDCNNKELKLETIFVTFLNCKYV